MFKKVFNLSLIALLAWVSYLVVYKSPQEKEMIEAINTRPTSNTFKEGFEKAETLSDLFNSDWSRWHELVIQNSETSIKRPIKHCMVEASKCLLNENTGNYVTLEKGIRRRGKNALKFHAEAFEKTWFGDSRAAIRRNLFEFKKGDDIYFSGWFYFKDESESKNLEAQNLNQNLFVSFRSKRDRLRNFGEPGPGLFFSFRNSLGLRFDNWLPVLDEVHQDILNRVNIPQNKWVKIKMHLHLSDHPEEGFVEVWIDNKKIVAEKAQTLPQEDMIYSILELGVGSNLNQNESQTFYIDNVSVTPDRFDD